MSDTFRVSIWSGEDASVEHIGTVATASSSSSTPSGNALPSSLSTPKTNANVGTVNLTCQMGWQPMQAVSAARPTILYPASRSRLMASAGGTPSSAALERTILQPLRGSFADRKARATSVRLRRSNAQKPEMPNKAQPLNMAPKFPEFTPQSTIKQDGALPDRIPARSSLHAGR
eukprot:CAMPEP_0172916242 /NCGR_PEP_ID=MMETSP1075-20121228/195937_1 /TAXON_ID=2916 /ORGANISM="Ceratium fusus, Strain PA161109" /LENGTH=173 /DNA_ID=CAMNT_0013775497 /DNA_START=27 /DNA_END=545 /DNA_ORIENTATION=+